MVRIDVTCGSRNGSLSAGCLDKCSMEFETRRIVKKRESDMDERCGPGESWDMGSAPNIQQKRLPGPKPLMITILT